MILTLVAFLQSGSDSSGDIFAGTNNGGVFRSVESTAVVEEISTRIPSSFALEQNYPNPFNPTTLINYQVSKDSKVKLIIYNQLGQEVRTLTRSKQHVLIKLSGMDETIQQTQWRADFISIV